LDEPATNQSGLLLGDMPTNVTTAWNIGSGLQPLAHEAIQLLADLRFLDQQEIALPVIGKLVREKYESVASRLRPQLGRFVGDLFSQLPDDLLATDSPLNEALQNSVSNARKRTRDAITADGPMEIQFGDYDVALSEVESFIESASDRQRRQLFDAVLDWPDVSAVPLICKLGDSPREQERAELILTLRFGARSKGGWESWSEWLMMQARLGASESNGFREYAAEHAASIVLMWYEGVSDRDSRCESALRSLGAVAPDKAEFIDRWAEELSPDEWNSIDPDSVERVTDRELLGALKRANATTQTGPPPLPKIAASPDQVTQPIVAEPASEEPPRPSFWDVHVQPVLNENWYVFAGIAMVIVGASLLAYYTWDKAWWIRYTIMPGLLGGFTWALAGIAKWIERKGDGFGTMAATLRGAAVGLLPLNFMVVSLLARDDTVPHPAFMALLMATVYLILFGWGLLRWCSAVAPELRWLAGGTILFVNALVIVEPLNAVVFNSGEAAGALNIAFGFYLGFVAICVATVRFARTCVTAENAAEKTIPWFFGGTIALTFFQAFAWAHGMAEQRPSPSCYSIMTIMAGWLVLFVERRNIELFDRNKTYRTESFLGFALIFLGILLSATEPILRIFSFLLGGGVWMYQSSTRKGAIHHWIGLTLLVLGGAAFATVEGFPREWMAGVGVAIGLSLGLARICARARQRDSLADACAGMQMIVMLLTVVVAVLAQWHYHTATFPNAIALTLIAGHFLYAGLRENRLTWIHTAMVVLAVALPYLGFVDLEKHTLHGNTMVFGLSILSFGWLALLEILFLRCRGTDDRLVFPLGVSVTRPWRAQVCNCNPGSVPLRRDHRHLVHGPADPRSA
jgi:hypothetical protein